MKTRQMMGTVTILAAIIFGIGTPGDLLAKQAGSANKARGFFYNKGKPFIYLQEQIDELERRLSEYEAISTSLQTEVATVRQDILDIQTRIVQMQADIAADIKALEESLDQNSEQVEAIKSEIAYLQGLLYEKISELFQKVEQAETELRSSIAILQEQNTEYKNAIEQGQAEMAVLQSMFAESIVRLNAVENKVDVNSGLIVQFQDCLNIQNNINEIQAEINSATARIHENTLRIDDLERQIESMPVGTHELVMGDAVSGITISSSTDRYWLLICWTQLACYYTSPGYSEVRLYIDGSVAESVAQVGNSAAKRTLSLSHLQLLTKGDHTAKVGLQTSFVDDNDYSVIEKGKIIAISF